MVRAASVLRVLYESTGGTEWTRNAGWLEGDPCRGNWASSSEYDCFSGELVRTPQPVCCELMPDDNKPTVARLDLSQNNLVGTLPTQLGRLGTLRLLVLDGNSLSGTIPSELSRLERLSVLWLQYNSISGTLPSEIGKLDLKPHGCLLQQLRPHKISRNCDEGAANIPAACNATYLGSPTDYLIEENVPCLLDAHDQADRTAATKQTDGGGGGLSDTVVVVLSILAGAIGLVCLYELWRRLQRRRAEREARMHEEQRKQDAEFEQERNRARRDLNNHDVFRSDNPNQQVREARRLTVISRMACTAESPQAPGSSLALSGQTPRAARWRPVRDERASKESNTMARGSSALQELSQATDVVRT